MTVEEIKDTYGQLPREAIPEIMRAASEILDTSALVKPPGIFPRRWPRW